MKKIFIILTEASYVCGSGDEIWSQAAKEALDRKYSVYVFVYFQEKTNIKLEEASKNGAKIIYINDIKKRGFCFRVYYKILRLYKKLPAVPYSYYKLLNVTKEINPDLIYVNQGGTFTIVERPEIYWLITNFKANYFYHSNQNREHFVYNDIYIQKMENIVKECKGFFFVSKRNMIVAERQIAYPIQNIFIHLKNPILTGFIKPLPYTDSHETQMGYIGRIECRDKGLDLLFQVFSSGKWKKRSWKLNLYGTGPDLNYLVKLSNFYNIKENIVFHGFCNNILSVWEKNQVLIMPSLAEGTPLTVIEAMMCGRPVIGTDVGDIAELVINEKTGFLISAPTVELIEKTLEIAWESKNRWKQMGIDANEFITQWAPKEPGKILLDTMLEKISSLVH